VSPATYTLDTSCMVAAVCAWHERHEAAAAEIEARLSRGERLTVAAHALVECYAVLTRLPPPHRLAPGDAWTLVRANFAENAAIVALSGRDHAKLLGRLATSGIRGGRTYDALIAACAERAGAQALLTFNPRHFDPPPKGVMVIEPSQTGS
jgi:predicted nucleic acid-binding protein